MENEEIRNLLSAWIILSVVIAIPTIIKQEWVGLSQAVFFALMLLCVSVGAKKIVASMVDTGAEHRIWHMDRYGFHPTAYFKKEIPAGIIIPLVVSIISLGKFFLMTPLTYESRALKHRAAKRHGMYSFTEVTDWHNGLVGASGIVATLALVIISYLSNQESLAKFATYFALANLIPFSNLDGTQIFFGSRIIWTVLVVITAIFFLYSILLI